jgi:hypothetical protein
MHSATIRLKEMIAQDAMCESELRQFQVEIILQFLHKSSTVCWIHNFMF